ncbi:sodium:dicarboxylate symporter [Aeromonas salmonicida subsp. salmonicida]|uniref:Proton/glutamate symporter n=1 Tax=Aeromonas salmonicida subsp. salmonicida 01-B526 TaxID=1076135 RepID=A0ABN0DYN4_AERSS|nr:dicarboxylate/amino acid:cation symporter [Aeromonas salmonicida]EHI51999.1 proton/glutamate symporter [Aeromonas salmonicida subsp. salmonicida 01-B526]EKP0238909.1 dicarboxylate/amino acid:cation symporter [Aeromonas salmonicida]EKP0243093.1 dicarboxylate/amino acid:cation symporter [Aeromonas salmonicida]EKP0251476.1 dicarboxylate/amino acid:cation symporter [Aeromonas salmonicida]EKP0255810.1 dicarboxylate/amino acid:cation symporter [Aeromonas salmonicida]
MLFHGLAFKPWRIWTRRPLWLKTLIGMLTGIGLGLGFSEQALQLKPLGVLFVNTIQMLMVPLIFCSVIAGLTSLLKGKSLDRIGSKAIGLYLFSTAIAICIGLMMGWLLEPGMGANMGPYERVGMAEQPTLASVLSHLVPRNPVQAMVDGKILQVIVFAVALALNATGRRGRPAILFFTSLAEGMFKLTQMVMALAPYGVCALMAWMTGKYGVSLLLPLLKVIGAVYLGCLLHVLGVYSSLLILLARLNPLHYFKSIVDAQAVAFTSSSSSSTLPISLACAEKRLGVSPAITAKVLPIGATINMDGTALYQGVTALFVAQAFGVDLHMVDYLTIISIATLASIGTAGTPGTGLMLLTLTLTAVGLPLEGVALIAGIDRILDMARTTVNVSGDILVSVLIARSEKELDLATYHDASAGDDIDFTLR